MKVISVANQKGGVGKTTTAVNLGTALGMMGKRVLLCDLDPQANLTDYMGWESDGTGSISELIITAANNFTMGAQKKEMPAVRDCILYSDVNRVSFIPSDIGLAYADSCLTQAAKRESIVKYILSDSAVQEYDYVIIDCLPSLGILLINALAASDSVIIPVQTQKFAKIGLGMLNEIYSQVRENINKDIEIMGVLATMADNTVTSRNIIEALTEEYGGKMFRTVIHKSVEAAKSTERRKSMCFFKTKLGDEYKALAKEVVDRSII